MSSFTNLLVTRSENGLMAVVGQNRDERFRATFANPVALFKAFARAGITMITDNNLMKSQLDAGQGISTVISATEQQLEQAGFVRNTP